MNKEELFECILDYATYHRLGGTSPDYQLKKRNALNADESLLKIITILYRPEPLNLKDAEAKRKALLLAKENA